MDPTTPLPSGQPRDATVHHMRSLAAARVEHTSLRGVAREIGMSPTGLKKFLLGTAPYSPTLRRLRRWYVHHAELPSGELEHRDAEAAIALLTHDLPGESRRVAVNEVLDCLARGYDAAGRPRPRWVAELHREPGEEGQG
jgi:hypothetical protein